MTLCLLALNRAKPPPGILLNPAEDNPGHFHLWITNRSYGYAFTYDPHAADDWMFDSAAVAKHEAAFLWPIRPGAGSNVPYVTPGHSAPR